LSNVLIAIQLAGTISYITHGVGYSRLLVSTQTHESLSFPSGDLVAALSYLRHLDI